MGFNRYIRFEILIVCLFGLILSACNPATKGWSSVGGETFHFPDLPPPKSVAVIGGHASGPFGFSSRLLTSSEVSSVPLDY